MARVKTLLRPASGHRAADWKRKMPDKPVILVTGASSGIGEATARYFGRQGYRVAMAARRLERLEVIAQEIRAGAGQALPIGADLSRLEEIQLLVRTTLDQYGQIDVLL